MKKALLFLSALVCGICAFGQGYNELYEGDEARMLRETADSVSAFTSESSLAAFVQRRLSECGVDMLGGSTMNSFGIHREGADTLVFNNVVGVIPGYDKALRSKYIVVGTRLDPSNSTAVSLLLQLAARLCTGKVLLQRSLVIAAFGGAEEANAGSWYFLNRSFYTPRDIDAYVNLDLFGSPNKGFYAFTGANADLNAMLASMAASLQPVLPKLISTEPAPGDHRSFFASEIPSVFFTTAAPGADYFDRTDALEYEELNRQCEYLYNFCVALSSGPAPRFRVGAGDGEILTVPFASCDRKPRFLGSSDPRSFLTKWVYAYLRYPQDALDKGIQGQVQVSFIVDEKGKVKDVTVTRSLHPSLDAEAVRVIEASPDWKAGLYEGRAVRTKINLGVDFVLKKRK
ncbi:MAG: TonB family protein [Bacteroidales bacterium]|nr:TonB family protein [Bacteroidales bacterium]